MIKKTMLFFRDTTIQSYETLILLFRQLIKNFLNSI